MRRFSLVSILLFLLTISFAINRSAFAQSTVGVAAVVGELTLNISGFASPFASITITSNGVELSNTISDSQGAFSFSLNVQNGFSSFCISAIDKGSLKTSSCYSIPPLTQSSTITNLLLPPSLSSQVTQVYAGESITIFGYTVPGAIVTVQINESETVTVTADSNGYYSYTYKDTAVGSYQFNTEASKGTLNSSPSNKSLSINSLATPQSIEEAEDTITQEENLNSTYDLKSSSKISELTPRDSSLIFLYLILLLLPIIIIILFFIFRKKPIVQNIIERVKSRFPKK